MDYLTCGFITGPFVILNIVANAFYIFCMFCPLHGERIKQPLKLLLGTLICCTITYLMSVFVLFFSGLRAESVKIFHISYVVALCTLSTSMTSSVWLNFFYYTQIVPAQRALFIWIKKNIKSITYSVWLVERIYTLFDFIILFTNYSPSDGFGNNFTMDHMPTTVFSKRLGDMVVVMVAILKVHFIFCLCVMAMSSGSTVVYLCRHMRRMVANGQPLSGPRLTGQVRVTVTGLLQTVLYVSCAVWNSYRIFTHQNFIKSNSACAHFTIINVYMSGTTFNLGAGQAVFRQRAADIWLRAARCCRAPQVQQSEQGG